jgi:hypothetical protein
MKRVKILGTRPLPRPQQQDAETGNDQVSVPDEEENLVSREIIKKKPIGINSSGFISWIRKLRNTDEGMESEVEKPLLIAASGQRVNENEIKGQCDVCGGYDAYIFNCHVYGCKKALCLRHVYFFEPDVKKVPYCHLHYQQRIDNYDTWQEHDQRRVRLEKR